MKNLLLFLLVIVFTSCDISTTPQSQSTTKPDPSQYLNTDTIPLLYSPIAASYTEIGFCYSPSFVEDTIHLFNSCFDTAFLASAGSFCLPRLPLDSLAVVFYACKRCTTYWPAARINEHDDYFSISDSLFAVLAFK